MAELTLRLGEDDGTKLRNLHYSVYSINSIVAVLMVAFGVYMVYPITYDSFTTHNDEHATRAFHKYMEVLGATCGTLYSILTLVMIVAFVKMQR